MSGAPIFTASPSTGTHASQIRFANDGAGSMFVGRANSSGNTDVFSLGTAYINFVGSTGALPLVFLTSGVERLRIGGGGNCGIGTNDPQRGLHIHAGFRYTNRLGNSTQTALHINTSTGDIAPTASSLRYKRNIEDYTKGLETLMQLRPVSFNFLEDDLPNCGLIAEEVDALNLPEFIRYDEEDLPISIPYDNLAALYVNAIKQLKQENDSLREELNLIKAHLGL